MIKLIRRLLGLPIGVSHKWKYAVIIISILGLLDTGFLTYEHYQKQVLPCPTHVATINTCQIVAESTYSTVLGVPVSLVGLGFFLIVGLIGLLSLKNKYSYLLNLIMPLSVLAFLFSVRLTYLQFFVIKYTCYYCLGSALLSLVLLGIAGLMFKRLNFSK